MPRDRPRQASCCITGSRSQNRIRPIGREGRAALSPRLQEKQKQIKLGIKASHGQPGFAICAAKPHLSSMANRKGKMRPTMASVKEPGAMPPISSTRKKRNAPPNQQENEAPTGKRAIGVSSALL